MKKSELYSLLWEACNKLRGGVEPSRYKDYVLVLLFFKYVSDRFFKSFWRIIDCRVLCRMSASTIVKSLVPARNW